MMPQHFEIWSAFKVLIEYFLSSDDTVCDYSLASAGHIQEVRLATKCGRFLFFSGAKKERKQFTFLVWHGEKYSHSEKANTVFVSLCRFVERSIVNRIFLSFAFFATAPIVGHCVGNMCSLCSCSAKNEIFQWKKFKYKFNSVETFRSGGSNIQFTLCLSHWQTWETFFVGVCTKITPDNRKRNRNAFEAIFTTERMLATSCRLTELVEIFTKIHSNTVCESSKNECDSKNMRIVTW